MILKCISEKFSEHVHERFFVGPDVEHLAFAGELTLRTDEWLAFNKTLNAGAETRGELKFIHQADGETIERLIEEGKVA